MEDWGTTGEVSSPEAPSDLAFKLRGTGPPENFVFRTESDHTTHLTELLASAQQFRKVGGIVN